MKKYATQPIRDTPEVKLLLISWKKISWFTRTFALRRKWVLTKDYVVYSPRHKCNLLIPKGFVMDFSSVPKALNNIMSPTGATAEGSVPHDFGYRYGGFLLVQPNGSVIFRKEKSQKDVDKTMVSVGVYCTDAKTPYRLAYRILRVAGRFNYKPKEFNPAKYEL